MRRVVREPRTPGRPLRFSLVRVPFFLEPDYPRDEGFQETNLERLRRKWGGAEEFEAQKRRHRLKDRGRAVGIQHFRAERVASNTHASHRLVQWVTRTAGPTAAERLYADLNFRHFELGRKLNDRRMLSKAAGRLGVPGITEVAARDFLESGEGEEEIAAALRKLRDLGIHSIPTTIVDGQFSIGGALPSDEVERLFRKIEAEGETADPPGGTDDADFPARFEFAEALGIPPGKLLEELDFSEEAAAA